MKSFVSKYICVFLIISLVSLSKNSNAQNQSTEEIQYHKIFGESFIKAESFLSENKWMKDTLFKRGIDAEFALSIVFPELIRYSKLFDLIEVSALKTLYLQFGKTYSNFSIGRFQMKPSFAESIEKDWNLLKNKPKALSMFLFDTLDNIQNRKARLVRLENIHGQLLYLSMFIFIVKSAHSIEFKNKEEMLLFYSTAYNYSYSVSSKAIISKIYRKSFHTDVFETPLTNFYCYSDIALFYYKNVLNSHK